jgi:hypothetical protein
MKISAAEYALMQSRAPKKQQAGKKKAKYSNKKVVVDGHTFDSKAEARRYGELKLQQRAGEIFDLEMQVPIPLQGRDGPLLSPAGRVLKYKADFTYLTRSGDVVVEDVKGFETPEYKLKRAILAAMGITIREVRYRK